MMTEQQTPPRLALHKITKAFPQLIANDSISLTVNPGEIHGLIGHNGAGKSTLVQIICGLISADHGQIFWNGEAVDITSPQMARKLGIAVVFQHFSLFEGLSVLENIALGLDKPQTAASLKQHLHRMMQHYGFDLDLDSPVRSLSAGQKQRIEIARALLSHPQLLIMDEPTSVLTSQETATLFAILRKLAADGCSILYISHKLPEIQLLCQEVSVLRDGKLVQHCHMESTNLQTLTHLMLGHSPQPLKPKPPVLDKPKRLEVKNLSTRFHDEHLKGISFTVHAGEILGIAGVAGNGQNALMHALTGELQSSADNIYLNGVPIGDQTPAMRRKQGLCSVPEQRHNHSAVTDFNLAENGFLTARHHKSLMALGLIKAQKSHCFATKIIQHFAVQGGDSTAKAKVLSGGNLQKFILGREILQDPAVLVVAQPTWGVDAGATQVIHQALLDLAAAGCALVVISHNDDELHHISHQVITLDKGSLLPI